MLFSKWDNYLTNEKLIILKQNGNTQKYFARCVIDFNVDCFVLDQSNTNRISVNSIATSKSRIEENPKLSSDSVITQFRKPNWFGLNRITGRRYKQEKKMYFYNALQTKQKQKKINRIWAQELIRLSLELICE